MLQVDRQRVEEIARQIAREEIAKFKKEFDSAMKLPKKKLRPLKEE